MKRALYSSLEELVHFAFLGLNADGDFHRIDVAICALSVCRFEAPSRNSCSSFGRGFGGIAHTPPVLSIPRLLPPLYRVARGRGQTTSPAIHGGDDIHFGWRNETSSRHIEALRGPKVGLYKHREEGGVVIGNTRAMRDSMA